MSQMIATRAVLLDANPALLTETEQPGMAMQIELNGQIVTLAFDFNDTGKIMLGAMVSLAFHGSEEAKLLMACCEERLGIKFMKTDHEEDNQETDDDSSDDPMP